MWKLEDEWDPADELSSCNRFLVGSMSSERGQEFGTALREYHRQMAIISSIQGGGQVPPPPTGYSMASEGAKTTGFSVKKDSPGWQFGFAHVEKPSGTQRSKLVGGLEHFLFSHILGIIIPID